MSVAPLSPDGIRLLVSDVDGTLVTSDKRLTAGAQAAARMLENAGIAFAITSSRPPFGLRMMIEPLGLTTPLAAFNGGLLAMPDGLKCIEGNALSAEVACRSIDFLAENGVGVWLFTEKHWLVTDRSGAYVDHEIRTIQTEPTVVSALQGPGMMGHAYKIVGASADFDLLVRCEQQLGAELRDGASVVRSQRYYLDVTHPLANKGHAVHRFSELLGIPRSAIATIGDGRNDVPMFAACGFSVSMGNADQEVQQAAHAVTASNEQDGFALAVERFILPRGAPPSADLAAEARAP